MIPHYRRKGVIGLLLWTATLAFYVFAGLIAASRDEDGYVISETNARFIGVVIFIGLFFQTSVFLWGGSNLAKAKGIPHQFVFLGLMPCLQPLLLTVLLLLEDRNKLPSSNERPQRRSRSGESKIARVVRYRRNAFIGNFFGLFAILSGVFIMVVPLGIALDPDNEVVVGIFIFILGYSGVLVGCW